MSTKMEEHRLVFKIYLERSEVCRIYFTEINSNQEATLEVFDKDNLPSEIHLMLMFQTCETSGLIAFLKGRVLPSNRMFLEEQVKPFGISVDDWIGKMRLNKGRTYDDEFWIDIEDR